MNLGDLLIFFLFSLSWLSYLSFSRAIATGLAGLEG